MNEALFKLLEHPDFPQGSAWVRRKLRQGETLLEEGELSNELYLLLKGTVRVVKQVNIDDKPKVRPGYGDVKVGETMGELCLLDGNPRSASVVALTDCEVAVIRADTLLPFLDAHPEIGYLVFKDLWRTTVSRLRQADQRFVALFAWGLRSYKLDQYL